MTHEEQLVKKAEMLKVLGPLGFIDKDPQFTQIVHQRLHVSIDTTFSDLCNVLDIVYAIALQRGEKATINRVKDSLGIN